MNTYARRDKLLDDFQKAANGSFSAVYRALTELSSHKRSPDLKAEEVTKRIKEIVLEQHAG
jgi:hypothetical protein